MDLETLLRTSDILTLHAPLTSTLRRRGGLVADYRIFMDATPAFGTSS